MRNEVDSLSYALGVNIGANLAEQKIDSFNFDLFAEAFKAAYLKDSLRLPSAEADMFLQAYFMEKSPDQNQTQNTESMNQNTAEGKKFLSENRKKEGVTETSSGLQYEVLKEGTGAQPGATDQVTVHYEGRLLSGKKFDSSYDRGQPATFGLNQVIPGWTEGVQLMKEGSKYRFYIPPGLAYGSRGAGESIPPNSTLIFDVELIKVGN
ncbi:MAG: FKBP-type peptidyl-prolyl cis-trans isomerase [Bacteroidia bacterium]